MKILYTDEIIHSAQLSPKEKTYLYNGMDVLICREVWDKTHHLLDETTQKTYNLMLALQAPIFEMMLRGCHIDTEERARKIRELEREIKKLESILNRWVEPLWDKKINARSWQQKAEFFYDFARVRPVKKFDPKSGKSKPTTDRAALEKIATRDFKVRPIANVVLAIMDGSKALGTLRSVIDADGFFRASFLIAGTETGRLSSKKNVFGTGCFPPGAEVLTPQGWIPLESVTSGQVICQSSGASGILSWVPAEPWQVTYTGSIETISSEQACFSVTSDHRTLCQNRKTKVFTEQRAIDLAKKSEFYLPLSGKLSGINEFPRLIVALIADGSNEYGNYWRISLKKPRKIKRFLSLCSEAGISPKELQGKSKYARFSLHVPESWPSEFGPWLLNLTQENALSLLKEAAYWDGHTRGNSFMFFSAQKSQSEWVQTLAHLCGYSATIRPMEQPEASWSTTLMWFVNVKPRNFAHIITKKHHTISTYSGLVYCVNVPSSFFLVKWKGKISITGNSNFQNWRENLRTIFCAQPGPIPDRDSYNIPEEFRCLEAPKEES